MSSIFPSFEPEHDAHENVRRKRFRLIPIRMLIPNMITLLALCMGLTAIRMGIEGRYELAIASIVVAAVLDSLDGRVARMLKSTSRFGAELDSLADFLNFGVAPAVLLYNWALKDLRSVGWIGVLCFSIAMALRLARFNVALDRPKPSWQANFFVGMPAPAGALTVMLPLYISSLNIIPIRDLAPLILVYVLAVAFFVISTMPTYSGKAIGQRVPREAVLPILFGVLVYSAFLLSYPWETLTLSTFAYIGSLPLSFLRYRALERRFGKILDQAPQPVNPATAETGKGEQPGSNLH